GASRIERARPPRQVAPSDLPDAANRHGRRRSPGRRFADVVGARERRRDRRALRSTRQLAVYVRTTETRRHGETLFSKYKCRSGRRAFRKELLRASVPPWFRTWTRCMLRGEEPPMFQLKLATPKRQWRVGGRAHAAITMLAAALTSGAAVLIAQQQAAEAPASNRTFYTRPAVAGLNGIVTTGHPIASSAGLQMLLKGGHAFDAAVAVGAMAALGEPEMNGIGGNGFMTIFDKKSGKVHSLSMAGAAPEALKTAERTPETLNAGMKAGIVPGNLGGYLSLLDRMGTMSIADVFAPAIEYAEKGYPIDPMLAQSIDRGKNNLGKYPTTAKIFLPNGQPLKAGELLKTADAAQTLRKLVEAEKQALAKKATRSQAIKAAFDRFYKGDIAQEF